MRGLVHAALPLVLSFLSVSRPVPAQITLAAHEGFVDAGANVRLFYRVVGAGIDTIVVLHGGPGFTMNYLAADLERAGLGSWSGEDVEAEGRELTVIPSAARDPHRPDREPSVGMMRILRYAQDDDGL